MITLTRDNVDKFIELATAFRDGTPLQYYEGDRIWNDCVTMRCMTLGNLDHFRIKPNPVYRPFTPEELVGLLGKQIRHKEWSNRDATTIIDISDRLGGVRVFRYASYISNQSLLDEWLFLDGSPCGVLEQ